MLICSYAEAAIRLLEGTSLLAKEEPIQSFKYPMGILQG